MSLVAGPTYYCKSCATEKAEREFIAPSDRTKPKPTIYNVCNLCRK